MAGDRIICVVVLQHGTSAHGELRPGHVEGEGLLCDVVEVEVGLAGGVLADDFEGKTTVRYELGALGLQEFSFST